MCQWHSASTINGTAQENKRPNRKSRLCGRKSTTVDSIANQERKKQGKTFSRQRTSVGGSSAPETDISVFFKPETFLVCPYTMPVSAPSKQAMIFHADIVSSLYPWGQPRWRSNAMVIAELACCNMGFEVDFVFVCFFFFQFL